MPRHRLHEPARSPAEVSRMVGTLLRDVPDFPKPGVLFKDITPLLDDPEAFSVVVEALAAAGRDQTRGVVVDRVVGMEARGFILAAPVALALGVGFVPVRKPGKLPWDSRSVSYALEYGEATLEMHVDALAPGDRVLLIDDVLATGGTAHAAAMLVQQAGGTAHGLAVLLELGFLGGRAALGELPLTVLHAV